MGRPLTSEEWARVPMPIMRRLYQARDAISKGMSSGLPDDSLYLMMEVERAVTAEAEAEIARQDDEDMRARLKALVRQCKDEGLSREQCLHVYICGAGRAAKKGIGRLVPDAEMHEMNRLVDLAYPQEAQAPC